MRIPKPIIVQITEEDLLISPIRQTRAGWSKTFKKKSGKEKIIGGKISNQFDQKDWKW